MGIWNEGINSIKRGYGLAENAYNIGSWNRGEAKKILKEAKSVYKNNKELYNKFKEELPKTFPTFKDSFLEEATSRHSLTGFGIGATLGGITGGINSNSPDSQSMNIAGGIVGGGILGSIATSLARTPKNIDYQKTLLNSKISTLYRNIR